MIINDIELKYFISTENDEYNSRVIRFPDKWTIQEEGYKLVGE